MILSFSWIQLAREYDGNPVVDFKALGITVEEELFQKIIECFLLFLVITIANNLFLCLAINNCTLGNVIRVQERCIMLLEFLNIYKVESTRKRRIHAMPKCHSKVTRILKERATMGVCLPSQDSSHDR